MLFKIILFHILNSIHINCVFFLFRFVIFMFVFFSRSHLSHFNFYLDLVLYSNLVSYFKPR